MDEPLRVRVIGRAGAGRRTMARGLLGAGIAVADPGHDSDIDVYVFVETLNADDRSALAASARPAVAVLNKADLAGFSDRGPLALVADRCRALRRETGVPVHAVCALLAVAATDAQVLDASLGALRTLAAGAALDDAARYRLAADLDVFGTALAVAALRNGTAPAAIGELLAAVSGIGGLLTELERAGALVRYRRAVGPARITAAAAALEAIGASAPRAVDHLARARHWQRYARGPLTAVHQSCAMDAARGALRLWAQSGGRPGTLP